MADVTLLFLVGCGSNPCLVQIAG